MTIINRYKTPCGNLIETETITTDAKNLVALEFYLDTLCKSGTYERLTDVERNRLDGIMRRAFRPDFKRLFGTAEQRRQQINLIFEGFIAGLGYYDTTSNWYDDRREA